MLQIYPDAASNFDRKAAEIVGLIVEEPPQPTSKNRRVPDFFVDQTITEADIIGEIRLALQNGTGVEIGKLFDFQGKRFGLIGDAYVEFLKFASSVQRATGIKEFGSLTFVKEVAFDWLQDEFAKKPHPPFTEHLLSALKAALRNYEVWIPIPFTSIEKDIAIGRAVIRNISADLITTWTKGFYEPDRSPADREKAHQYETKLRRELQGGAAGYITCRAERVRAMELAFSEVRKSLGVLRLFSPANHIPGAVSGAYEYGRHMVESRLCVVIDTDGQGFYETSEMLDKTLRWHIDSEMIEMMEKNDLPRFGKLISLDRPNRFQQDLSDAIMIYSKNALKRDLFDKLLYILVALETILLKNDTEPIQQNLADRIAFAIGRDLETRRDIVDTVKQVYSIRSSFIHHGAMRLEGEPLIARFLAYAWEMVRSLVRNADRFSSREACIEAIENMKYS